MADDGDGRAAKRVKIDGDGADRGKEGRGGGKGGNWGRRKDPSRSKYRHQAATTSSTSNSTTTPTSNAFKARNTAISASGLQSGDVGIFVTSDKGCEKRALREVEDLLEEYLPKVQAVGEEKTENDSRKESGLGKGDGLTDNGNGNKDGDTASSRGAGWDGGAGGSVEDSIEAELAALREQVDTGTVFNANTYHQPQPHPSQSTKIALITLDIPCVSFVRLPSYSSSSTQIDPVEIVYRFCRAAYADPTPRSRFIKRLTPLMRVRKVMNEGLERLCAEVLPKDFGREQGREWKYAVRVTVRNNGKVKREDVIKMVASYVVALGRGEDQNPGDVDAEGDEIDRANTSSEDEGASERRGGDGSGKQAALSDDANDEQTPQARAEAIENAAALEHKVNLKHFDKLILVEIYRNVVGMSVVGDAAEFEGELKRFNLAEIYAAGGKRGEGEETAEKAEKKEAEKQGFGSGARDA